MWKGEYLVWDRATFRHSDLRAHSTHLHQKISKPYVTRLCSLPDKGVVFPLKEHYERINAELFDPKIIEDDYEPHDAAAEARAPAFKSMLGSQEESEKNTSGKVCLEKQIAVDSGLRSVR